MQIKNRQRVLVIGAITAVVLFAGDKLVLSPLIDAWEARAGQIAKLNENLKAAKQYQVRASGLRNHWRDWSQRTLTNETSAAEQKVQAAIDSWAQRAGVTLNAITPQWKHDSDDYMTFECRIDAAGNLDRLARFLYQAERDPMALKFEAVELAARDKEGKQLSLGLQVSALVLNPSTR